jgi:hypothetical protein
MSVRVNFAFEKGEICIENSTNLLTLNYFSIQFSIENHSKWQPWTGGLVNWWLSDFSFEKLYRSYTLRHVGSSEFCFWKSKIYIENSTNLLTLNYFSIPFSIENHSKWQPRTGELDLIFKISKLTIQILIKTTKRGS